MKIQIFSGSKLCLTLLGVIIIGVIGLLIFYVTAESEENIHENVPKSLIMVHVIFRHGDKNPDELTIFPKSPLINETYFPYGIGQLSKKGRQNAYALGEELAQLYGKFLGNTMYPGLIDAISSGRQRTEMSLSLLLASLLPPNEEQQIISSLNWQPIMFNSLPINEDKILFVKNACPEAFHVRINHTKEVLEFFKFLEENTGFRVDDLRPVYFISVYLKENAELGLPTPEWALKNWSQIQIMGEIQHWKEVIQYNLPLLAGHLMESILKNTKKALSNQNSDFRTKMFLYSGHYHNIIGVLGALASYHEDFIEYSSQIILEIHLINDTYVIKSYFQNGLNSKISRIRLPFCGDFCPLDVFEEYQNINVISRKC